MDQAVLAITVFLTVSQILLWMSVLNKDALIAEQQQQIDELKKKVDKLWEFNPRNKN